MANAEHENDCRLCLVVATAPGADTEIRLTTTLAHGGIETVIIAPRGDATLNAPAVLPLIAASRSADRTVLIQDDADLARITKADGVHLTWSDNIIDKASQAREVLGQGGIIGADAGRSRHDAMMLGEFGVDYVAFGIPEKVKDKQTAKERRVGLIEWWAEIFLVPCMACDVESVADAAELSAAGADIVALKLPDGINAADTTVWLDKAARTLSQPVKSICEVSQ